MNARRVTPGFAVGAALTGLVILAAALSLVWTPYPPARMDLLHKLAPPSAEHWMGTDPYGRDVLSMLMAGARVSVGIAAAAVLIGAGIGVPLGLLAAELGGWVDEAVSRAADVMFAFPALLSAVMLAAVAGPGAITALVAIGAFNVPVFARVARAAAHGVWTREFVAAARAAGRSDAAITRIHVLPNIAAAVLVQATIQFALAIVAEAGLSYFGLGAQPPAMSWGRMLNEAQTYLWRAPLLAVFPGLCIALAVLGVNLLGDALQDRLDPRRRRARGLP